MDPLDDFFAFGIEKNQCWKGMGVHRKSGQDILFGSFDTVDAVRALENRCDVRLTEFGFHLRTRQTAAAVDKPEVDLGVCCGRDGGNDEKGCEDHISEHGFSFH